MLSAGTAYWVGSSGSRRQRKARRWGRIILVAALVLIPVATALGPGFRVALGMRYGNPSIRSRIDALTAQGCDRILVVPLYPQYAASTTASVYDAVFDAVKRMRGKPGTKIVITAEFVNATLKNIVEDEDLSRYIL